MGNFNRSTSTFVILKLVYSFALVVLYLNKNDLVGSDKGNIALFCVFIVNVLFEHKIILPKTFYFVTHVPYSSIFLLNVRRVCLATTRGVGWVSI